MTETWTDTALPDVNHAAETAVLGAMLNDQRAVNVARLDLSVAAFYLPWHGELFATICELEDAGHRCDAQLLVTHLRAKKMLGTDGVKTVAIFEMAQDSYYAPNVAYHARQVRAAARVRALQAEHLRMGQALEAVALNGDVDALMHRAAERGVALELIADEPDSAAPVEGLSTWDEFTSRQAGKERWVVPGLIGRHDMILILAAPGAGKSFLSRLVCTSLAAGLHPFTLERITPVRTLLVDLENAPGQVADEAAPLLGQVKRIGGDLEDRGWVWMRPEGLNLRRHEDAALFERVIAETNPDLVAFGSLYNAYKRGSDGWDVAAGDVQDVLKKLRSRYDLAYWVEHHMGRGTGGVGHTGTPYGGTDWEKWPTHGRVLRKAASKGHIYLLEAGTFRGDRGAREGIPLAVERGGKVGLRAIYEEAELELLVSAWNDGQVAS